MPVYNCESFIAEAIESIINQTYGNFEFIIIDDSSTDSTCGIITGYTDPRINFIKKDINTGLIDSLNLGIAMSKGEFIARMDGDDISHVQRLEKQVDFFDKHPGIVLCGTWYKLLSNNVIIRNPLTHDEIKLALLDYCAFGHPTVMLRKRLITDYDLKYDKAFHAAEDYELWTRIIALEKVANIPETLLYYRSHINQVTQTERADQIKHSVSCQIRMMTYPIDNRSENDGTISRIIVENTPLENPKRLREIITWLDRLANFNEKSAFYDKERFGKYISQKKRNIIRRFYLNTSPYNVKVLFSNIRINYGFRDNFTLTESIKFILKCLFFFKSNIVDCQND